MTESTPSKAREVEDCDMTTTSITNGAVVALWSLVRAAHWSSRSIQCASPKVLSRESCLRWMEGSFDIKTDDQEVIGNAMKVFPDKETFKLTVVS